MENELTIEFPPYQAVDICLGMGNELEIPPVRGWLVSEAGCDRQCLPDQKAVFMTESAEEATEIFCYALLHSKYPNCVQLRPCWIHSQQRVFGEITNRRFWTLR